MARGVGGGEGESYEDTWVRVPVLSEKMYWIWPSSSLRVVVLAWEEVR